MKKIVFALSLLSSVCLFTPRQAQADEKLILISDTVVPRIVVPTKATASEAYAAEELATYLGKITSKKFEVITSDAPERINGQSLIILGNHPLNADLRPEKLGIEESVVSVETNRLRIVGGSEPPVIGPKNTVYVQDRGTLYGVYEFLDQLGVRWYRPEPWGEFVPQRQEIRLDLGKKTSKPAYTYRWGLASTSTVPTTPAGEQNLAWAVRNRQNTRMPAVPKYGGSYQTYIHHNYAYFLPSYRYYKDHPEYFALVNGKRSEHREAQPCMGNPEVRELMATNLINYAKANPQILIHSLEPNDGTLHCECVLCRELDDPKLLAQNGGQDRLGKASMANRVVLLNNYLAKRLAEAVPGKSVAWLAYLGHTETPTKVTQFEPNTFVAPAAFAAAYSDYSRNLHDPKSKGNSNFLGVLKGYSPLTSLFTREYWSGPYWFGPLPYLAVMKDRLSEYRKYNVKGVYSEMHPSPGPHALTNYYFTRLLWNPDLDMEKELEEFCTHYYGPGAAPMLRYHRLVEKAGQDGTVQHLFLGRFLDRAFVRQSLIDAMTVEINEAKVLIGKQEPYAKRFEGAWAGYEFARLRCLTEKYKNEKNIVQALATWDELEKFVLSYPSGEVFRNQKSVFPGFWTVMSDQAGIKAMRNQLATLRANPNASILQNLNEDWKFSIDPQNGGLRKGVVTPDFRDDTWHMVNATSTWQSQGHNYLGTAWYRKEFRLDKKAANKKYVLFFGAVDGDAVIYLNGEEVGKHEIGANGAGWDKDFMIDITGQVQAGKNLIAVEVTKRTSVAGIFKGVSLMQL